MSDVAVADLRPVDLFDDVPDERLAAWAERATMHTAAPGEKLFVQGEPPRGFIFLLAGRLAVSRADGDRVEPAGTQEAPTWIGAIATLCDTPMG